MSPAHVDLMALKEGLQDTIFETYTIQSAANNVINLEVPLGPLQRALKSALTATSAFIRLTKKDNVPLLSLTITNNSLTGTPYNAFAGAGTAYANGYGDHDHSSNTDFGNARERETIITQDVPVRVLSQHVVAGLHEPRCREPDVHIQLPPLVQIKSVSDRFTKLALAARSSNSGLGSVGPKLEITANMHGCLKVSIKTDAMNISSMWTGLHNPELDPTQVEGGEKGIQQHPSTRMKAVGSADGLSEEGWARVRIDGRDWSKVLSVGRLGGKVIACVYLIPSALERADLFGRLLSPPCADTLCLPSK
jgi:HUS1 checkpoint protein